MRILFLDFDGVLNSHAWWNRRGRRMTQTIDQWEFDPRAIALLNEVVAGDVRVVVSSSWRLGKTVPELQQLLSSVGFAGDVLDKTEPIGAGLLYAYTPRSAEIAHWLDEHADVETYAIVDDDAEAGDGHRGHFVETKIAHGLTERVADELRAILFPAIGTEARR